MSGIYKKAISTEVEQDFVKCDKCNYEVLFVNTIDWWISIDDVNYCLACQKEHNVGHYEK